MNVKRENLIIWRKTMEFGKKINLLTDEFSQNKADDFSSQKNIKQ